MKKILPFMDWGIFALRSYHYILLLSRLFMDGMPSTRTSLYMIWLLAAFIVPILFWFPGRRMNKTWFCIMELLLGGSYYVNSVFHPDLASKADYLLPSLAMGYLCTRYTLWIIPIAALIPFTFQSHFKLSWEQTLGIGTDNLIFCFIGVWASSVANAYDQKNKLVAEVEQQNKLLTHYAAEVEKMTLLEERQRLSKELHDTLGHSFISLIMSLDAAIALLDHKPAEVKDRLNRLRELAERNLNEMRSIVHEMGDEGESNLYQQIETLAFNFRVHTGTDVALNLSGTEPALRFQARQTILRVIQESFTNALKHGKATQLHLELRFSETHVHLFIRNNGKPINRLEYGFGLTAMKQRVEHLGGTLSVSSEAGTDPVTEVSCQFPLEGVILHVQN